MVKRLLYWNHTQNLWKLLWLDIDGLSIFNTYNMHIRKSTTMVDFSLLIIISTMVNSLLKIQNSFTIIPLPSKELFPMHCNFHHNVSMQIHAQKLPWVSILMTSIPQTSDICCKFVGCTFPSKIKSWSVMPHSFLLCIDSCCHFNQIIFSDFFLDLGYNC